MITLIMGPMWAGKTTELIRMLRRKEHAGHIVKMYKSDKDTRYTTKPLARSHDGLEKECIPIHDAHDIKPGDATVIGIEEGQFIDNLVEICERFASQGIQVIVAALNADFNRNAFPNIVALIPKCEQVILLQAVCQQCKSDASFTRKLTKDTTVIDPGASDKYEAVCRMCHSSK